nr:PAS-domain containing protein [Sneathiella chinensis]
MKPELLELLIVIILTGAILYHFRHILRREVGLLHIVGGLVLISFALGWQYLMQTPLKNHIPQLSFPDGQDYLTPLLLLPGATLIFYGMSKWFPHVINYRRETLLRIEAENEVRRKNEMIEAVLDRAPYGIFLLDENLNVLLANRQTATLFNIPVHLLQPGSSLREITRYLARNGEYGDVSEETAYQQWLDLILPNDHLHFQRKRGDGTILEIHAQWVPGVGLFSTYEDVTLRAYAERDLARSEERFRDFTESASDWMWETNPQHRISYMSDRGLALAGLQQDDIVGRSFMELLRPSGGQKDWRFYLDHFSPYHVLKDLYCEFQHPDGSTRYAVISGKPVFDHSNSFQGYRGVGRDITVRRQFEETRLQSQRLEAVGRLTGGIAHDFNNLLAVILGNSELLLEGAAGKDSAAAHHLNVIQGAATRGADLTQRLLAYSRKQRLRPAPIDLRKTVGNLLELLEPGLGADIRIVVDHQDDIWDALSDVGQLENALLNLANNARDAMPDGGLITLSTRNHVQRAENTKPALKELLPGHYVQLSVQDTGGGMPENHVQKAFDPFFTTKEVGKGTGLGLSMVFGFAKQSNGLATLESTPTKGTTVSLYLPQAKDQD